MTRSKIYKEKIQRRSVRHTVRGVNYHVSEWGDVDQPLLFLLHGWGDCGASFQFLVDQLREKWFLVAPDWRGFGESGQRAESYWFPDYIADLDVLLDLYSADVPARLLGHSMGANIAALYAGVMPERVAALINVEGFGLPDRDPAEVPGNYRRWIEKGRDLQSYASYENYHELAQRIIKRSPSMGEDKALFVAQQWACEADDKSIVLRADPAHRLPNAVLYRRAEAEACWREIQAPMLLVIGEDSEFRDGAKKLLDAEAESNPFHNCRTCFISSTRHMVHFEQPKQLANAAETFLLSV